jgi:hypothetical protein
MLEWTVEMYLAFVYSEIRRTAIHHDESKR